MLLVPGFVVNCEVVNCVDVFFGLHSNPIHGFKSSGLVSEMGESESP